MTNHNLDESITFDNVIPENMKKNATEDNGETRIVGADLGERLKGDIPETTPEPVVTTVPVPEIVPADEAVSEPVDTEAPETEYDGPGLVIENAGKTDGPKVMYNRLNEETQANIDKYLADMDKKIEEMNNDEEYAEYVAKRDNPEEATETETESDNDEDFDAKYESATVIIDKSGFGSLIDFSAEERAKLEKVKKIKVEEIETLELSALKTKKTKKKEEFNAVIKKRADYNVTNIVLPISGYTATVSGCSAYELISLMEPVDENPLMKTQNKWSVIHSKVESTSIGNMDFNEFLQNTAANDYDTFIYGILCATYPEDDSIDLNCPECGKAFPHKYSARSLIRAERMSAELQDTVMKIVDASAFEQTAKKAHAEAPISMVKRIKLPDSEIIIDLYVQSAYDLIKKRAEDLKDLKDEKYQAAAAVSTLIRTAYIYDETDDTYFELDDSIELAKMVYALSEVDVLIINKVVDAMYADKSIEFGFMNINCPHCKAHRDTLMIGLDDLLFHRYRQAINTVVE